VGGGEVTSALLVDAHRDEPPAPPADVAAILDDDRGDLALADEVFAMCIPQVLCKSPGRPARPSVRQSVGRHSLGF